MSEPLAWLGPARLPFYALRGYQVFHTSLNTPTQRTPLPVMARHVLIFLGTPVLIALGMLLS